VVDIIFLVSLARLPRAPETTNVLTHFKNTKDRMKTMEDLLWALTNTREFLMGD
jgi:hypothetical protein